MAAKPISALNPSLSELCLDAISLKPLTDAVQLNCYCYYNEETAKALQLYGLPCIQHERIFSFYGNKEERVSLIVRALLKEGTSSLGKELTSTNVSAEIPIVAKSLFEKGNAFLGQKLFKEAARAFLGATLHCPSYIEAQKSLESALTSLRSSSGSFSMPGIAAKPLSTRPILTRLATSPQNPASAPVYNAQQLVCHDNHLP